MKRTILALVAPLSLNAFANDRQDRIEDLQDQLKQVEILLSDDDTDKEDKEDLEYKKRSLESELEDLGAEEE